MRTRTVSALLEEHVEHALMLQGQGVVHDGIGDAPDQQDDEAEGHPLGLLALDRGRHPPVAIDLRARQDDPGAPKGEGAERVLGPGPPGEVQRAQDQQIRQRRGRGGQREPARPARHGPSRGEEGERRRARRRRSAGRSTAAGRRQMEVLAATLPRVRKAPSMMSIRETSRAIHSCGFAPGQDGADDETGQSRRRHRARSSRRRRRPGRRPARAERGGRPPSVARSSARTTRRDTASGAAASSRASWRCTGQARRAPRPATPRERG